MVLFRVFPLRQRRMSASFLARIRRRRADPLRNDPVTSLLLNGFRPCLRHRRRFSTASRCQVLAGSRCHVATQLITSCPGRRLHGRKLVAWSGTGSLNTFQCLLGAKTEMKNPKTRNLEAARRNPRQAELPCDHKRRMGVHLFTAPQQARLSLLRSMRLC